MPEVIQLAPPITTAARHTKHVRAAVRTDALYVVFTTIEATLEAVRVASALAQSMAAPLTLVHFRSVPFPLAVDSPASVSSAETEAVVERIRDEGIAIRARVYLCRNERRAFPMAFERSSIIVIGGTRRWFGAPERLRRQLERAGHFVLLVNEKQRDLVIE